MEPAYIENPVSTHRKLLHITFTKQKNVVPIQKHP